jgi:hypothetical protein
MKKSIYNVTLIIVVILAVIAAAIILWCLFNSKDKFNSTGNGRHGVTKFAHASKNDYKNLPELDLQEELDLFEDKKDQNIEDQNYISCPPGCAPIESFRGGGRGSGRGGMPGRGGRGGMPGRGGRGSMPGRGGRGGMPGRGGGIGYRHRPYRLRPRRRPGWWGAWGAPWWGGTTYYNVYESPPTNYGNCECEDDTNTINNCLYGNPYCDEDSCICGQGGYWGL